MRSCDNTLCRYKLTNASKYSNIWNTVNMENMKKKVNLIREAAHWFCGDYMQSDYRKFIYPGVEGKLSGTGKEGTGINL